MNDTAWDMSTPAEDFKKARRQKATLAVDTGDKLPPHSVEAEQGVLGCVMLSPRECIGTCVEFLVEGAESFYDLRHRAVYETMLEMFVGNIPIDLITLQQRLSNKGQLEGVGGLVYLASLPDAVPSAANLRYYLDIVQEKQTLRKMISTCTEVVSRAYQHRGSVNQLMDEVERDILGMRSGHDSSQCVTALDAVNEFNEYLNDRIQLNGERSGLTTGLIELDRMTDGIQYGEQFIIGARPSIGKTAIGLNIFRRVCLDDKIPAIFISLEQGTKALMRRLAASCCRIGMHTLKRGIFTDEEASRLREFNRMYRECPATIYDFVDTGATAQLIASVVRRAGDRGVKLVIIDYLQKVRPSSKQEKRTYEVGEVSGILRSAAVSAGVAMVTLAQLNRENEREKGRSPRISDLADSGQIERDADVVGLLHRDRSEGTGMAQLIIGKQRDGETGICNLLFQGQFCEFVNPAHQMPEMPPMREARQTTPD